MVRKTAVKDAVVGGTSVLTDQECFQRNLK